MIVSIYKRCISKESILKIIQLLSWLFSQSKKIETKIILIGKKSYKDLVTYFTKYLQNKSIKMLSLYYHELMGKVKKHEGW